MLGSGCSALRWINFKQKKLTQPIGCTIPCYWFVYFSQSEFISIFSIVCYLANKVQAGDCSTGDC